MISKIPLSMILAYQRTLYRVKARPKGWMLRIGHASRRLESLYRQENLSTAVFITAYNPYSQKTSKAENVSAQRRLVDEIQKEGFSFMTGIGKDPGRKWGPEASLLVLGLSLKNAKTLGKKYRQNAIVFVGKNAIPRLVLLR
jgi:hypothetical protein